MLAPLITALKYKKDFHNHVYKLLLNFSDNHRWISEAERAYIKANLTTRVGNRLSDPKDITI